MSDDAVARCLVAAAIAIVALSVLVPIALSPPLLCLCGRCKNPMPDGYWCRVKDVGPVCRACGHECGYPHEFDKFSYRPPEVL